MVFLISTFYLFYCEILWVSQIYTRGPYAPWTPPSGEIFVPEASTSQYLIVFNFNILPLVVSEILGAPKFTLGGSVPPVRPLAENFCTRCEYVTMSNGVFNFNFLSLLLSEILGGPKFTLGGPTPPSGEIFVPKASTSQYLIVFLISTF